MQTQQRHSRDAATRVVISQKMRHDNYVMVARPDTDDPCAALNGAVELLMDATNTRPLAFADEARARAYLRCHLAIDEASLDAFIESQELTFLRVSELEVTLKSEARQ